VSNNLTAWSEYVDSVDQRIQKRAARVNARYVMARRFRHATFDGGSAKLQSGYSVLIKVGLAYSALEALEKLTEIENSAIHEPDVAFELQQPKFVKLLVGVNADLSNKKLIAKIVQISSGESTDVRPLAQGLRHLVFHGEATVNGLGLNGDVEDVLRDLADVILEFLDEAFNDCVVH